MGHRRSGRRTAGALWVLALALVSAAAIVRELSKPPEERTWHGEVAGMLPYDLRRPTIERLRAASWNPDGPLLSRKAWGFGWTINLGAMKRPSAGPVQIPPPSA